MFYIIYKTVNRMDSKEYIGAHSTYFLEDGYIGSGSKLKEAINEYGKDTFTREIIFRAVSEDIMYWIESMIVDKEYIDRNYTYNQKTGGRNGSGIDRFSEEKKEEIYQKRSENPNWIKGKTYEEIMGFEKAGELKQIRSEHFKKIDRNYENNSMFNKNHSNESKELMSNNRKGKYVGDEHWTRNMDYPDELRKKISESVKNIPKKTCEYCGSISSPSNYSRWHGDNCKHK